LSNDKEYDIGKFEKLKHKDGNINYGKDYAKQSVTSFSIHHKGLI
jgi:hypothetical protein